MVWSLWRHWQSIVTSSAECKPSEWVTVSTCEDHRFFVIYGFVMSCKKYNNVCTLVTNGSCAHTSIFRVFISLVAAQSSRERINRSPLEYIHYSVSIVLVWIPTTLWWCWYLLIWMEPLCAPLHWAVGQTGSPGDSGRNMPILIARFVGPTCGPPGNDRTQLGPMLAPLTLLSG